MCPAPEPSGTAHRRPHPATLPGMGYLSAPALLTSRMQHGPLLGLPQPKLDRQDFAPAPPEVRGPAPAQSRGDEPSQVLSPNKLLEALPLAEVERLGPSLARVHLVREQVLVERGQAVEHLFFLEGGLASMVAEPGGGRTGVQIAMIGREGLVGGLALLTGHLVATASTVVVFPGPALRIPSTALWRILHDSPVLHASYMQGMQALLRQVFETAASAARDSLVERCARWILMAQDRMETDDLPVTHDALSAMLGARRPGVTVAMGSLHDAGLIRTGRGRIKVVDRPGLEAAASGTERLGDGRAAGRRRRPGPQDQSDGHAGS